MLGFKKTLNIALQASDTVRQAITALLLDGYTGVRIDRALIPSVYTGYIARHLSCQARDLWSTHAVRDFGC